MKSPVSLLACFQTFFFVFASVSTSLDFLFVGIFFKYAIELHNSSSEVSQILIILSYFLPCLPAFTLSTDFPFQLDSQQSRRCLPLLSAIKTLHRLRWGKCYVFKTSLHHSVLLLIIQQRVYSLPVDIACFILGDTQPEEIILLLRQAVHAVAFPS